nr:MAG TPA: hypothetical protein [Caudoviricetes sp.]
MRTADLSCSAQKYKLNDTVCNYRRTTKIFNQLSRIT